MIRLFASNYTTVSGHVRISEDEFTDVNLTQIIADRIPDSHPTIAVTGADKSQFDSADQRIAWSVVGDVNSVDFRIYNSAGVVIEHIVESGTSGEYDFNDLAAGTYTFEVLANGYLSTKWSESITIVDEDQAAPFLTLSGSRGTVSDQQSREFTWSAADVSGISTASAIVTGPTGQLLTSSDQSGSFSLNSYGPGTYQIKFDATDADADWTGDQKSAAQAKRSVSVYDDDVLAPEISFSDRLGQPLLGSTASESHGLATRSHGMSLTNPE